MTITMMLKYSKPSLACFSLLLAALSSYAQHFPDRPAIHGMLLMGTETIYASHLPMFHSPHDYQIILALNVDEEGRAKYLADRKAHPEELVYTIEPEVFVLPDMINHIKKFKASIYRGHFERGGTMIAKEISVTIEQVVYYYHFQKKSKKPEMLRYILFGNEKEQFLAHQISAQPDFDEVLSVKASDGPITASLSQNGYKMIEFKEKDEREYYSWKSGTAKLLDKDNSIEFKLHQQIYFELGDLD